MSRNNVSSVHAFDGSLDPNVQVKSREIIKAAYKRPDLEDYTNIVLPGIVPNCVDVFILDEDEMVLMGHRVNAPLKGCPHTSGGRQANGDSYGEAAAFHVKRDLDLDVDPSRFEFVMSSSFPFSSSAQGVPCHMNGVQMAVRLSRDELAKRSVPTTGDFADSRFFALSEVTEDVGFHPAVVLGVRIIQYNLKNHGRLGTIDPDLL